MPGLPHAVHRRDAFLRAHQQPARSEPGALARLRGNLAGLPGKGYARVLTDENFSENVLFTEATRVFDTRLAAGATDVTHYRFQLPAKTAARDVRIETKLYYRRAFKPIADQRHWNVP